jgi:hypothetical protein
VEKLDLKKQFKSLYTASAKKVTVVDVPPLLMAVIDGEIPPHERPGTSARFAEDVGALYSAAYTLKFMIKKRESNPIDYPVMPLEGLWSAASGRYDPGRADTWNYRIMIMQPDFVSADLWAAATAAAQKKKPNDGLARVELVTFHEGPAIQMLHLGPYATEPETLARMDDYATAEGYTRHGLHHEIYLSDPLRTAPERLKTILRHPIEPRDK